MAVDGKEVDADSHDDQSNHDRHNNINNAYHPSAIITYNQIIKIKSHSHEQTQYLYFNLYPMIMY